MDRDYVSPVHTFAELLKLHERVVKLEAVVAALVTKDAPAKPAADPAAPAAPAKPAKKG